jgi:hypothetical protein
MRLAALFALSAALLASPAHACWQQVPMSKRLVADALESEHTYFPGDGPLAPFVLGHLFHLRESLQNDDDTLHGAVVFVKRGADWTAYIPSEGESAVAAMVSTEEPAAFLVLQLQVEGPGQSFTAVRADRAMAPADVACAEIAFPEALNNPGWAMETLHLESLQVAPSGGGALVASSEIDLETNRPRTLWWRYGTADGGRTWTAPRRIPPQRAAKPGALVAVDLPLPDAVRTELTAAADGR